MSSMAKRIEAVHAAMSAVDEPGIDDAEFRIRVTTSVDEMSHAFRGTAELFRRFTGITKFVMDEEQTSEVEALRATNAGFLEILACIRADTSIIRSGRSATIGVLRNGEMLAKMSFQYTKELQGCVDAALAEQGLTESDIAAVHRLWELSPDLMPAVMAFWSPEYDGELTMLILADLAAWAVALREDEPGAFESHSSEDLAEDFVDSRSIANSKDEQSFTMDQPALGRVWDNESGEKIPWQDKKNEDGDPKYMLASEFFASLNQ